MTKEQAVKQVAVLEALIKQKMQEDTNLRNNFSFVFGRKSVGAGLISRPDDMSWPEIWVEIGKLLANQERLKTAESISELRWRIEHLEEHTLDEPLPPKT